MLRWLERLEGRSIIAAGVVVAVGQEVYSFGWRSVTDEIEVKIFNTVSMRWRTLSTVTTGGEFNPEVPSKRDCHTVVLIGNVAYLWGGLNNHELYCNVLYAFDVDTHRWFHSRVSGTVPEGRVRHSACVLEKVMYVYGGRNQTGLLNDVYELDSTAMVWSLIDTRGTPGLHSSGHSSTIIGTKMFVFGGGGEHGHRERYLNNIRVFDTDTDCWLSTPSAKLLPKGRFCHSAFAYNGELYIYDGFVDGYSGFNDLWKFNPETFSWKKVQPKGKDMCSMPKLMCCCKVGERIIFVRYSTLRADHFCVTSLSTGPLYILHLSPTLKTLCKLMVIQYGLDQSELPHDIRWELGLGKMGTKEETGK